MPDTLIISNFSGSKSEKIYLAEQLESFHADGWIDEVLFTIKRGKEAAVYCCKANPETGYEHLAAKVYHPREVRAMQNYSAYTEGRGIHSATGGTYLKERERKAVENNTEYGRNIRGQSWTTHEFHTLQRFQDIDVEAPYALEMSSTVILMEYYGTNYRGAPTLIECKLDPAEAPRIYEQCLQYIERMLEDFIIHGDLSAYNILFHEDRPIIIDVPQVIDPMANTNARFFFDRDLKRVCEYFNRYGIYPTYEEIADELWQKYVNPISEYH